jgi:hypothetical protein
LTDEGRITPLIRPFGAPSPQGEDLVNNNLSFYPGIDKKHFPFGMFWYIMAVDKQRRTIYAQNR